MKLRNVIWRNCGCIALFVGLVTGTALGQVTMPPPPKQAVLTRVGGIAAGGSALGVQVVGNYALLAAGRAGLQMIDVSNPAKPFRVASRPLGYATGPMKMVGNIAYVITANWDGFGPAGGSLEIFDVSDPTNLVRLGGFGGKLDSLPFTDVEVVGNYAYLSVGNRSGLQLGGLQVIDVSDPSKPVRVGEVSSGRAINGVKVVANHAYLAAYDEGLFVYDLSKPTQPAFAGFLHTGGHAQALQVVGRYVYMVNGEHGFYTIDVNNPLKPVFGGSQATGGYSVGLHVVENHAFVAAGGDGLQVMDVSNPAQPLRVGGYDTAGFASAVKVVGNHAYVADYDAGLQILEFRLAYEQTITWQERTNANLALNSAHPLGATASSGLPLTFRVDSGPAVVADGVITVTGLGTIWVTAEQAGDAEYSPVRDTRSFNVRQAVLKPAGRYDTGGLAYGVQVAADYAYVADFDAGLLVLNVSNPAKPMPVGQIATSSLAYGLQMTGSHAYVADADAGLQVIDVSNPTNPVRRGSVATNGDARGVQVVGNYAYVADHEAGLQVIDVSQAASPVRVGGFDTAKEANGVHVVGDHAYMAIGSLGLQVVDVSDPANPGRLGRLDTSGQANGVQVVGNYAYVADGDAGLQVIDVSNPAVPVRVGGYDTSGQAEGVQVVGHHAYVADGDAGLQVIDVSNPARLVRVGGYDTSGYAHSVSVTGGHAYVADGEDGLQVIDLKLGYQQTATWKGTTNEVLSLGVPYPLGAKSSSGLPVTLRVDRGPAVISGGMITVTGKGTVEVTADQAGDATYLPVRLERSFNVPQIALSLVGRYAKAGGRLQVAGDYVYMTVGTSGLLVIDVSDPANPVRIGGVDTPGSAYGVQVVGNYAYVGDSWLGWKVIDVSNPFNPVLVSGGGTGGTTTDLNVVGNYVYVASEDVGVFDVSNPILPLLVAKFNTSAKSATRGVRVVGDYAYVVNSVGWDGQKTESGGLHIINVTNPVRPVRVGVYDQPEKFNDVQVIGNLAYIAVGPSPGAQTLSGGGGLQVVDVSNPTRPLRVGSYDTGGDALGVQVVGTHAYMTIGPAWDGQKYSGGGLQVIDVSNPTRPVRAGGDVTLGSVQQVVGDLAYLVGDDGMKIMAIRVGLPQALELQLPAVVPFHGSPVSSAVTADSGLPVTLSVVSGPASVVNGQLVLTGLGRVTLRADQAGDDFFLPASAQWTVTVTPPQLGGRRIAAQVELFWAAGLPGLQLQSRSVLATNSPWLNVTNPPVEAAGEARVRLEAATPLRYFRLFQP